MALKVNVTKAFNNPAALLRLLRASQNPRHAMAKAGVARIRAEGLSADQVNLLAKGGPRGFYSAVLQYGYEAIKPALLAAVKKGSVGQALAAEFETMQQADQLFGSFDAASTHRVLDLNLTVYPGTGTLAKMGQLFPEQKAQAAAVRKLIEVNLATPGNKPSPIELLEDHPGWASEKPDIRNIRGNMAEAVREAVTEADYTAQQVEQRYGKGTMAKIENIVVAGIGANDMWLKDLPTLNNADPSKKRNFYSIFEPAQLDALPDSVRADNTLYIGISRSGGTQETVKSFYFGLKEGRMKYLVGYANKGLLKDFVEQKGGIALDLASHIGGRYMHMKGKIVLVPFRLTASDKAWKESTEGLVDFDGKYWPVGEDTTIIDAAEHLYMYSGAYSTAGLFVSSNQPVLEAGLREVFQLHNEAVGKIINGMIAFGPGMEMLPFAHAGADGILGSAVSAQHYGLFMFDASYNHDLVKSAALTAKDLLPNEADHVGLTKQLLQLACVFPNQAKFTYAGAPNMMVTMDGVNFRNLATVAAFYQNLMYPYLIMNETNPDSNPNVAMVRKTTNRLITASIEGVKAGKSPVEVMQAEIPNVMKG